MKTVKLKNGLTVLWLDHSDTALLAKARLFDALTFTKFTFDCNKRNYYYYYNDVIIIIIIIKQLMCWKL